MEKLDMLLATRSDYGVSLLLCGCKSLGAITQLARVSALQAESREFKSH